MPCLGHEPKIAHHADLRLVQLDPKRGVAVPASLQHAVRFCRGLALAFLTGTTVLGDFLGSGEFCISGLKNKSNTRLSNQRTRGLFVPSPRAFKV